MTYNFGTTVLMIYDFGTTELEFKRFWNDRSKLDPFYLNVNLFIGKYRALKISILRPT